MVYKIPPGALSFEACCSSWNIANSKSNVNYSILRHDTSFLAENKLICNITFYIIEIKRFHALSFLFYGSILQVKIIIECWKCFGNVF